MFNSHTYKSKKIAVYKAAGWLFVKFCVGRLLRSAAIGPRWLGIVFRLSRIQI